MPDTELMDQVLAIITEVPELHNQAMLAETLPEAERRYAEQDLSHVPTTIAALIPDCGSAHCFAGWVLVLRGYRYDTTVYRWLSPDGVRLVSPPLLSMAAAELGISYDEAYDREHGSGIFWEDTSPEAIHLWVAYYKGEIDRDDLECRLGLPDA